MLVNPVEARVRQRTNDHVEFVMRAADVAVHATFGDLVACAFATGARPMIHVELPSRTSPGLSLVRVSGSSSRPVSDRCCPDTVSSAVNRDQRIVDARFYQQASRRAAREVLTRVPVIALAATITEDVDDGQAQTHCVLPIWSDDSAVLLRLDWFGAPSPEPDLLPEWCVSASSGLPVVAALRQFAELWPTNVHARPSSYQLCFTPWVLGARLFEDDGAELPHRVWQREWRFETLEDFTRAIRCVVKGLLRPDPPRGAA